MKIQCDVCERAPATVICCADEAALCAKCDVEVHAANKLASKHQRLLLHSLSSKLPKCDICQDKPAFIFCVEDRALFCEDCDEPIHAPNTLAANHQRLLATGIQVALTAAAAATACSGGPSVDPPASKPAPPNPISASDTSSWSVDDLLHFTDQFDSASDKHQKEALDQLGEFEWLADMGMLGDHVPETAMAAAEVPQLQGNHITSNRPPKSGAPFKKPRIESPVDEDEYFIVPDLG